jgi:polysaccharide chain length determinant protein (PEP-CTERM system associated)
LNTEMTNTAELVPVLLREVRRYRVPMAALFAAIALSALVVGILWDKTFSASTTIIAQSSDIIQPLMEGRAVPTGNADRAGIARQVIYSQRVMNELVKVGGWEGESALTREKIIDEIKQRTQVTSPRPELIQITYRDKDRKRTFDIAQRMAELFVEESREGKERESREAFEFIDSQVASYHKKLTDSEDSLLKYRTANVDAQPGSAGEANSRINALRQIIDQSRINLNEQQSSEAAIAAQLNGESEVTAVQTRESLYRAQLVDLQTQLDRLLLTYTEQYPDVVRIRHQMQDVQRQLAAAKDRQDPALDGRKSAFDNAQFNPHYQELRRQLGEARRQVAETRSRLAASEQMLKEELERNRRIAASEGALAELTRDYEVNRDIYQDLLKRRENARVSMEMDQQQKGLTLRIQDPAVMPLRPSGLRLMHFAAGGLTVASALPWFLLFTLIRFDPRVRSVQQLERMVDAEVLATIPRYDTARDRMRSRASFLLALLLVVATLAAYAIVYWFRLAYV